MVQNACRTKSQQECNDHYSDDDRLVLTGLWHGTGYNYLAWGIYWGLLMILSIVFAPEIKKLTRLLRINTEARSWGVVQMIRTFIIFTFARLITIPGHLQTTWDILKQICKQFDIWILFDGTLFNYGLNGRTSLWPCWESLYCGASACCRSEALYGR